MKLDYSLDTVEARVEFISMYASSIKASKEKQADYILLMDIKENKTEGFKVETRWKKKQKEISMDSILNHIELSNNNKLRHRSQKLTREQIETVPECAAIQSTVDSLNKELKAETDGKKQWLLRHTIMSLNSDKYLIYNSYNPMICTVKKVPNLLYTPTTDILEDIDLCDPKVVLRILSMWTEIQSSTRETSQLIRAEMEGTLKITKLSKRHKNVLDYTIAGLTQKQMAAADIEKGLKPYRLNYYSTVKNTVAEKIAESYPLYLHYKKMPKKKCSYCGEMTPIDPYFFCRKHTAKDGLSARCKTCDKKLREERKK